MGAKPRRRGSRLAAAISVSPGFASSPSRAITPGKSSLEAAEPGVSQKERPSRSRVSRTRQSLPVTRDSACSPRSRPVMMADPRPARENTSPTVSAPMTGAAQPERPSRLALNPSVRAQCPILVRKSGICPSPVSGAALVPPRAAYDLFPAPVQGILRVFSPMSGGVLRSSHFEKTAPQQKARQHEPCPLVNPPRVFVAERSNSRY